MHPQTWPEGKVKATDKPKEEKKLQVPQVSFDCGQNSELVHRAVGCWLLQTDMRVGQLMSVGCARHRQTASYSESFLFHSSIIIVQLCCQQTSFGVELPACTLLSEVHTL